MAVDVSAFTALARSEFMQGKLAADNRVMPAAYDQFVTNLPSKVRVETHTYRSEERRVGKECTSWCRSRWSPYH